MNKKPVKSRAVESKAITLNEKAYSGKGLIALTESPTYNLHSWASKTYKIEGNIRRMVNSGYHKSEVWESILFQIMAGLYVLQINNIAFTEFDIENNIYIKDITHHGNITKYWKYVIDGFEFYIPNHGFLVLIDSNYKDLSKVHYTIGSKANQKVFKLYSNIFSDDSGKSFSDDELKIMSFKSFIECFNPNNYGQAFSQLGGTPPTGKANQIIEAIYTEAKSITTSPLKVNDKERINIGYYMIKYMKQFLNNRVGTFLKENEINYVKSEAGLNIKAGQIVVYETSNNTYKFAIFHARNNNNTVKLITRDKPKSDIDFKDIPIGNVKNYIRDDNVLQNYKPNTANLNEDDLLEVYVINKN
jgi:hypothetical protein